MDSDLYKIGLAANTDKIYHHGYHRFYHKYIKRDVTKLLEIGLDRGESMNMWLNYCPNARIYGMDIDKEFQAERAIVIQGNQSKKEDLQNLIRQVGDNIDVILDDGSHVPEHQLLTFKTLFPFVRDGGVYIIEDIETSYYKRGEIYGYKTEYGPTHNANIVNVFQDILHMLNREFMNEDDTNMHLSKYGFSISDIDAISTVTFGQNCIIITKKEKYEYEYAGRQYRFLWRGHF